MFQPGVPATGLREVAARFHQAPAQQCSSKVQARFQRSSSKDSSKVPARFQQGSRTVPVFRGVHFRVTTSLPEIETQQNHCWELNFLWIDDLPSKHCDFPAILVYQRVYTLGCDNLANIEVGEWLKSSWSAYQPFFLLDPLDGGMCSVVSYLVSTLLMRNPPNSPNHCSTDKKFWGVQDLVANIPLLVKINSHLLIYLLVGWIVWSGANPTPGTFSSWIDRSSSAALRSSFEVRPLRPQGSAAGQ